MKSAIFVLALVAMGGTQEASASTFEIESLGRKYSFFCENESTVAYLKGLLSDPAIEISSASDYNRSGTLFIEFRKLNDDAKRSSRTVIQPGAGCILTVTGE